MHSSGSTCRTCGRRRSTWLRRGRSTKTNRSSAPAPGCWSGRCNGWHVGRERSEAYRPSEAVGNGKRYTRHRIVLLWHCTALARSLLLGGANMASSKKSDGKGGKGGKGQSGGSTGAGGELHQTSGVVMTTDQGIPI